MNKLPSFMQSTIPCSGLCGLYHITWLPPVSLSGEITNLSRLPCASITTASSASYPSTTSRLNLLDRYSLTSFKYRGLIIFSLSPLYFHIVATSSLKLLEPRSEERRVGKECRSRW